jgi:very-short-patch-repair endonuclease
MGRPAAHATHGKVLGEVPTMAKWGMFMRKKRAIPKELSEGEETFWLHCRARLKNEPLREVKLIPGREWRFDFFFPEQSLAIEIDGGTAYGMSRHSRGRGYENDARKLNSAAAQGIRVLRFTSEMVKSGEAIKTVIEVLDYIDSLQYSASR